MKLVCILSTDSLIRMENGTCDIFRKMFFAFVLLTTIAGFQIMGFAADRVALVIGNGAYKHARKLPNPTRDAASVAALLKKSGFEVINVRDANIEAMYEGLERFKRASKNARVGLLYFAGHGFEVNGNNYLLPVDAALDSVAQLRTQTVALKTILADMKEVRIPAKLVILDCCRDNPLSRSWMTTRSSKQDGLSAVRDEMLPEATMIMYAAAPGKVALDGTGENSPFTTALVKHLGQPGVSAFDAFLAVSDAVAKTTNERQVPWIKFDGAGRTFRLFSLSRGDVKPSEIANGNKPLSPPITPSDTPKADWKDQAPDLPQRGYFGLSEVYIGGPFEKYSNYSHRKILMRVQNDPQKRRTLFKWS